MVLATPSAVVGREMVGHTSSFTMISSWVVITSAAVSSAPHRNDEVVMAEKEKIRGVSLSKVGRYALNIRSDKYNSHVKRLRVHTQRDNGVSTSLGGVCAHSRCPPAIIVLDEFYNGTIT